MKIIATVGWVLVVLDACAVMWLFAVKNAGDDAAGRGMATGFAIVLAPVVLLIAAGLWWAGARSSNSATIAATLVAGLPFLFLGGNFIQDRLANASYSRYNAGFGQFSDANLRDLAVAIDARDNSRVKTIAADGVDWSARDVRGQTIFGHAMKRALEHGESAEQTAIVSTLLNAGAKYQENAMEENGHLFANVMSDYGDIRLRLIELLLKAGANANGVDPDDNRPLLIHPNMTLAKARRLIEHGAEVKNIRDNRTDRPRWDALMNAAYSQDWPRAIYYLELGCDPAYRAADGRNVGDVVADLRRSGLLRDEVGLRPFLKVLEIADRPGRH